MRYDVKILDSDGAEWVVDKIKYQNFVGTQAEWNALTASEKAKYAMVNITDQYSTAERYTGKKWIDGKKIYRKMISITTPSSGSSQDFSTGVNNIDTFINLYGMVHNTSKDFWIPIQCTMSSEHRIATYYKGANASSSTNNSIVINVLGSNCANSVGYIVFEYTKSTD